MEMICLDKENYRFRDYENNCDYYANQKQLTIHRDVVRSESGRPFIYAYNDNLLQAMDDLSASAFKVYVYLLMNKDGYKKEFSPAAIAENVKIHKDTARDAFKQMIRKGYLEQVKDYKYNFYEVPKIHLFLKYSENRAENSSLARTLEEINRKRDDYNYDNYDW